MDDHAVDFVIDGEVVAFEGSADPIVKAAAAHEVRSIRSRTDDLEESFLRRIQALPSATRRLLLIAPYYLTLKTTVDDLSWDDGPSLMLKFSIPFCMI